MPRIFLQVADPEEKTISITGETAHYLTAVLRCRLGDDLTIFDGSGNCYATSLVRCDRKEVTAEVMDRFPCNIESPLNVMLVQGILKGEKMGMVIQKATELGVREIIPAVTERSQIRETRKTERWRKIAEEASRQCGRSSVPVVHEPTGFREVLLRQGSVDPIRGFIFYEEGGRRPADAAKLVGAKPEAFVVAIGPEGGFAQEEVRFASEKGLHVVSLGKRILRAETASIAALTLVQFLFGDMS